MGSRFTGKPVLPENPARDQGLGLSDPQAAKVFNTTRATAKKWLKRDEVHDRSHRPHRLHTTLSSAQENIVLALPQTLYLLLDDLLFMKRHRAATCSSPSPAQRAGYSCKFMAR